MSQKTALTSLPSSIALRIVSYISINWNVVESFWVNPDWAEIMILFDMR